MEDEDAHEKEADNAEFEGADDANKEKAENADKERGAEDMEVDGKPKEKKVLTREEKTVRHCHLTANN